MGLPPYSPPPPASPPPSSPLPSAPPVPPMPPMVPPPRAPDVAYNVLFSVVTPGRRRLQESLLDKMASALAQVLATFEVFIEPATVKLEECETPYDAPPKRGGSGGVETAVTIQVASFTLANATKNAVDTYPCADPSCFWQQLQDELQVDDDKIAQGTCVDPDEPVKIVRVQFLPPTAPPPDAPLTQMLIVNAGQNVETGNKQLKDEEIVGIVLGSIFGVFLLCALAGLVVMKRRAPKLTQVEKE